MTTPHDQDPSIDLPIAEPLRPASAPTWTAVLDAPERIAPAATTDAVAFSTRNAGPGKLRAGVVAGAAVALAVGAVATSFAASPTPAPTTTAPSTTTRNVGNMGAMMAPALVADPEIGVGDTFDHGRMSGHGFNDITITSIDGTSVALKTADGWTRTVTVTDSVKLTKGGQEIALSDLAVGDEVRIEQTRNDDGTYTVTGLAVVVPSVQGTVSDLSSSGFKVTGRDGSVWTITVNGSTQYQFGAGDGTLTDVTNGAIVGVQGESTGDNALTALTVHVAADRVSGTVKSKTSDTIVITQRDGTTLTVHVDADTTYRVGGVDTADLGDITVDMAIGVSGRERSDGSIDADVVMAGDGHGLRGGPGDGFFGGGPGRGGFGPGKGDDDGAAPAATPTPSPTSAS